MYSNLIVWMFLAGGFQTFLIIAICVAFVIAAVMIPVFWYRDYDDVGYLGKERTAIEKKIHTKWLKKCFTFLTVWGFVLAMTCIIPDRQTILAWAALHAVDQYNTSHTSSTLTPDGILNTGDNVVKIINEALAKAEKALK